MYQAWPHCIHRQSIDTMGFKLFTSELSVISEVIMMGEKASYLNPVDFQKSYLMYLSTIV